VLPASRSSRSSLRCRSLRRGHHRPERLAAIDAPGNVAEDFIRVGSGGTASVIAHSGRGRAGEAPGGTTGDDGPDTTVLAPGTLVLLPLSGGLLG
jgi:hypothetical protein